MVLYRQILTKVVLVVFVQWSDQHGSFWSSYGPFLNGELLKNWEQWEVRIHVVHIIVKLITLMFLHWKRTVLIWVKFDSFPKVISRYLIPFIVFLQQYFKNKACKKGKKKGILGGFYFYHIARQVLELCISKINEISLYPPSACPVGWPSDYSTSQKIVGSNPSRTHPHGL